MTNTKAFRLWIVNVLSFILLCLLTLTGLTNWLLLPKGCGATGSFLVSLRHFLVEVHEWAALLFMLTMVVHLVLHWGYIKANLKKYGLIK